METKLNLKGKFEEMNIDDSKINIFISSADFTLQNVAMKIGLPVIGVDGKIIKRIKNYILKCASCSEFIYDTRRLFCEKCGNNITMKIGFSIDNEGNMKIYDKEPEARLRGKIVKNIFLFFFTYFSLICLSLPQIKRRMCIFFQRIKSPKDIMKFVLIRIWIRF